jgi:tRNA(Ile)-lysidine synthetase-like protein
MRSAMRDRVERFIQREALLTAKEPVLVAVSGGVDSMVLLHVLCDLSHPCTVAHVDHQLRGPESDADRQFVQAHCDERSIPFLTRSVAPRELAEKGGRSLQMAARELRLEALRQMALEAGLTRIALAHHADDAVETLLMNLMRGTVFADWVPSPPWPAPSSGLCWRWTGR